MKKKGLLVDWKLGQERQKEMKREIFKELTGKLFMRMINTHYVMENTVKR